MAVSFDAELLNCIAAGLNDQATLMLMPDLAKASDGFGTLLHHAVSYDNHDVIQRLMDLGAEVDAVGEYGRTPLMLAVGRRRPATVRVLLEAGASVEAVDAKGQSVLRMALDPDELMCANCVELLIDRVRAAAPTRDQLVERLLEAGFTLNHAVCTKDLELLQALLSRADVDVHSITGDGLRSALLDAVCTANDVGMVRILCDRGADVNALDQMANSALVYSARRGNADLVQLLLDRGADPNSVNLYGSDPLRALLASTRIDDVKQADRCAELLLQRGASVGRSRHDSLVYLSVAMSNHSPNLVETLVAHLTMNGMFELDTRSLEGRIIYERDPQWFAKCVSYHHKCENILGVCVFGATTLADLLLKQREHRMRLFVRNVRLMSVFEDFCSEFKLQEKFSYYYNTLRERIMKKQYTVELEDEAVPVISDIFNSSYNKSYVAARKIVEYLNDSDLEQLCKV